MDANISAEKIEKRYFIKIGILMTVLSISFMCYMGNSLYQASKQLFEEIAIEYIDTSDLVEEELS